MLGTLAAAAALTLAPAQAGSLQLTNARTTYGEMGAVRTDARYLPHDFYFLAFDMDGLAVSPEGKVSYSMMVEVTDKAGKAVFKQDTPSENEEFIVLGGNRKPTIARPQAVVLPKEIPEGQDMAFITLVIPLNREGNFTAELKATDATSGKITSMTFPLRVVPPAK